MQTGTFKHDIFKWIPVKKTLFTVPYHNMRNFNFAKTMFI